MYIVVYGRDHELVDRLSGRLRSQTKEPVDAAILPNGRKDENLTALKNSAATLADEGMIWFLNADCVLYEGAIKVAGELLDSEEAFCSMVIGSAQRGLQCFLCVSRSVFMEVGGFRPFFLGDFYDEYDLCWRLGGIGLRCKTYQLELRPEAEIDFHENENDRRAQDTDFQTRHALTEAGYL